MHPPLHNKFAILLEGFEHIETGDHKFLTRLSLLYLKLSQDVRLQILLAAAISILAAFLRFFHLGDWSLWIEEYHSVSFTQELSTLRPALLSVRPVFPLLLKPIFLVAGVNEWTARLLPAAVGVLTIPLLFWAGKKLYGLQAALLAALLLAVSPWHLYWSQNARFYALFLLFFNISLFAFYWAVESDNFRYILVSLAAMVLAVLTHGLGILLVLLYVCYFLLVKIFPFEKPAGLRLRNLLPFLFLPIVGYVSYEFLMIFVIHKEPLFTALLTEFSKTSSDSWIGYSSAYIMLTSVVYYLGTPLTLLALTGSLSQLLKRSRSGLLLSIAAFVSLGLMMLLTELASTSNRYLFMTLPAWVLLAAAGVQLLYRRARNGKILWPWILGFLILFVKDPVIEDILYYLRTQAPFRLLLPAALLISILFILAITQMVQPGKRAHLRVWGTGILLVVLAHPLAADSLYFAYQNGHRDDWKAAVERIRQEKIGTDRIVSYLPALVTYYSGEPTMDIHSVQLDQLLLPGQRVWIIEDYGLEKAADKRFDGWVRENCVQKGNWDMFTAGVIWRMRVNLCNSTGQDTNLSR